MKQFHIILDILFKEDSPILRIILNKLNGDIKTEDPDSLDMEIRRLAIEHARMSEHNSRLVESFWKDDQN